MDALLEATPETPSYMIGIRENKITRVPLMEAVEMVRDTFGEPFWIAYSQSEQTIDSSSCGGNQCKGLH